MALLAAILPPALFPEIWLLGKDFYYLDLGWFHLPLRELAADYMRSGQWPLWNPYSWNGFPLLGSAAASALSPLNLPFLLGLPPGLALNVEILAHTSIAGLSAYALARQVHCSPAASLLAALSYACGGWIMAQIACLEVMLGIAWVPLICALLLSANESRQASRALLAGGVFALQIYSTHPQFSIYTLLLLAALSVFCAWSAWNTSRHKATVGILRPFAYLALVVTIGVGLSAPQIATSFELLLQSRRSAGLSLEAQTVLSMPPPSLLTLLFPRLFLVPTDSWRTTGIYDEYNFYVGLIPLTCAIIALKAAWRGDALLRFAWTLTILTIVLALGHFTPIYTLLLQVPGISILRGPGRWLFITAVMAIILVGKGADYTYDWLVDTTRREEMLRLGRTLTVCFFALCLTVPAALLLRAPDAVNLTGEDVYSIERMASRAQVVARLLPESLAFMLNGGLILVAFWFLGVHRRSPRALAAVLLVLTFGDLFFAGGELTKDASYWESGRSVANFVQAQDRLGRLFSAWQFADGAAQLWQDHPALMRVYASSGSDLSQGLQREEDYLRDIPFLRGLQMSSTRWLVMPNKQQAAWDRFGVLAAPVAASLTKVYETGGAAVFEVPDPLPRAYVVYSTSQAASPDVAVQQLKDPGFDMYRAAVVESGQTLANLPASRDMSLTPATIIAYGPTKINLELEAASDSLLVLTDTYYPGWRVWVDGNEDSILRANYLFRGVLLRAGHHLVEFDYAPSSFQIGLAIAGATGLLSVSAVVARRRLAGRRNGKW